MGFDVAGSGTYAAVELEGVAPGRSPRVSLAQVEPAPFAWLATSGKIRRIRKKSIRRDIPHKRQSLVREKSWQDDWRRCVAFPAQHQEVALACHGN